MNSPRSKGAVALSVLALGWTTIVVQDKLTQLLLTLVGTLEKARE